MFQWVGNNVAGLLALWGCLVSVAAAVWCVRSARRKRGKRRCPGCGYDMDGIPGLTCPECGVAAKSEALLVRRRVNRWWLAVCALGFVGSAASWGVPEVRSGRWLGWVPTDVIVWVLPWLGEYGGYGGGPPSGTAMITGEIDRRCVAGELSEPQWRRLVKRVVEDAERVAVVGGTDIRFKHMGLLKYARDRGMLSIAARDRMDALVRPSFEWTSRAMEGYPVYTGAFWRYRGWPYGARIEYFDPDTKAPMARGELANPSKCSMDASYGLADWIEPVAVAMDPRMPVCVLVRITERREDERSGLEWFRTVAEDVVEIPGPVIPKEQIPLILRRSEAVEAAIRAAKLSINLGYGYRNYDEVCFGIDTGDFSSTLDQEGIDVLAVRFEVMYRGIVIGYTRGVPLGRGVLRGNYGVRSCLFPRINDVRRMSDFQVRVIADAGAALINPNTKVCWDGEVTLSPTR